MALIRIRRRILFPYDRDNFMAIFSGSEGGLATTTGIITGLMIDEISRQIVIITAMISFIVQAFNSAASRFSSERTDDEIDHQDKKKGYHLPLTHAAYQFSAHIVMSLIVITPIALVDNRYLAIVIAVLITLIFLFLIGGYKAKIINKNVLRDGLELAGVGLLVTVVGLIAGVFLRL